MQFSTFSVAALRAEPLVHLLSTAKGQYKVQYQAFSLPENLHKSPVVFLGGAFQSFSSFRAEVELVIATHPIILADFPSQGSNDQLAPELSLPDYADLVADFCDAFELPKVIMLGISYGSAMATLFATRYPEKVERLLLSGITCFRRESLITLLEDSLSLLAKGDMEGFAATAVCNLINHNRLNETEVSPTYRRLLFRQIARLTENERQRYAQNTQRLLDFPGFDGFPACPTLIATGEYDNFTLPSENAAVARQCANATFAVVHNADHLAQFERKEATSTLFHRFMCGDRVDNVEGTEIFDPVAYDKADQRLQSRQRPLAQPYELTDESTGKTHIVRINNINFAGCELEQTHVDLSLSESSGDLWLSIPETGCRYHVRVLERERKVMRCLIIQRDLKHADQLLSYLEGNVLMVRETAPETLQEQLA
ncbi:alpha/beta fold hydrolase [Thalassolituus sp. LLYu03]|uniref:alpha/beta fold hydrolase n=1 Tax=Thalassolituus sp. LLYu03 TaxID=3421656 RepID=UPI003D28D87D